MKRIICLVLAVLLAASFCGCERTATNSVYAMDAEMQLQIWGEDSKPAMRELEQILAGQEAFWGEAAQDAVPDETILESVEALSERTGGAVDIWLGGALEAYGFYDLVYRVPTEEELAAGLEAGRMDMRMVIKGHAADLCAEALSRHGITRGFLQMGEDVQTYGQKPEGEPWVVGIPSPEGGTLGKVSVDGTCAVFTATDYRQYFERDGVRYHPILVPETGKPANTGLRSVTVICKNGLTADGLSTALFVMGLEKATEFWQGSDDFEAVFLTTDGKIYATAGVTLSGCEFEVIAKN